MPYRRAWVAIAVLLVVAGFAFWPGFLSHLHKYGWAHHLHGITATLWMLLLISQSLLVDRRDFARHRLLGRSVLLLVPLFTAAGTMMLNTLTSAETVFSATFGDALCFVDLVAVLAFAGFCYAALANRRNPAVHGGYLLVTPGLLVMAVVTRLPIFFDPDGPLAGWTWQQQFVLSFDVAMVLVLSTSFFLGLRYRRHPVPFIALGAVTLVQGVGFHTVDALPVWKAIADVIADAPMTLIGLLGLAVGSLAVSQGWQSGKRRSAKH